ncbi:MAG: hypothetical protein R2941_05605 [Desulfobacterales bacterium]
MNLFHRYHGGKRPLFAATVLWTALFFWGCGREELPVREIQRSLAHVPDYSIVLEDMKEEGNFFKDYSHRYRLVQADTAVDKGWFTVPENFYRANENFLGMVIAGRRDGNLLESAVPLVYQYVGNPRYGQWQSDGLGGQIWGFNPGIPLFGELDIDLHSPIHRRHYDSYKHSLSRKIPYYGSENQYGTNGAFTKKSKPDFFARRMAKQTAKKASFSQKVASRVGRTKTAGFRGRSGSSGK